MRKTVIIALWALFGLLGLSMPANSQNVAPGASVDAGRGFLSIPGFDFLVDRVRGHGFAGRAWDVDGRPYQTFALTLNDRGPVYVALGAYQDSLENSWYALGGGQFDALTLWRAARDWPVIEKMGLIKLPADWRFLVGPMVNGFRVRPDKLRIDRDVLYNAALHIPLGGGK